jgi:hypothetical protein
MTENYQADVLPTRLIHIPAVASYQKELQQTRIELILSKTYHISSC